MKKKVGIIKQLLCIGLVFLIQINSFATIVSDNDGSAFITKAEFDALKSSFQSQIDTYNQSIDSKIDGAIAAYLSGLQLVKTSEIEVLNYHADGWAEEADAALNYSEGVAALALDWAVGYWTTTYEMNVGGIEVENVPSLTSGTPFDFRSVDSWDATNKSCEWKGLQTAYYQLKASGHTFGFNTNIHSKIPDSDTNIAGGGGINLKWVTITPQYADNGDNLASSQFWRIDYVPKNSTTVTNRPFSLAYGKHLTQSYNVIKKKNIGIFRAEQDTANYSKQITDIAGFHGLWVDDRVTHSTYKAFRTYLNNVTISKAYMQLRYAEKDKSDICPCTIANYGNTDSTRTNIFPSMLRVYWDGVFQSEINNEIYNHESNYNQFTCKNKQGSITTDYMNSYLGVPLVEAKEEKKYKFTIKFEDTGDHDLYILNGLPSVSTALADLTNTITAKSGGYGSYHIDSGQAVGSNTKCIKIPSGVEETIVFTAKENRPITLKWTKHGASGGGYAKRGRFITVESLD